MSSALLNLLDFDSIFHLDFETFSEVDLKAHGLMRYATDPSTEILLASYCYDDRPVDLYDIAEPSWECRKEEIWDAITNPRVLLAAFNAPFEREILKHVWGLDTPIERWVDAMMVGLTMSLPGSLDGVSKALNLPSDKAKIADGKRLIQKFSKPQAANRKLRRHTHKTDPEDWHLFGAYCVGDTEAERFALNRMSKFLPPKQEFELWYLDQKINTTGLPLDMHLVNTAQELSDELKDALKRECAILTGLDNPNSRNQFLPWVRSQGYSKESLGKDYVTKEIANNEELTGIAKKALALRSQFGKNSVAKFKKIDAQQYRGRLYYTTQFAGAGRTWRWAGRGAQYHNLPRPLKELEKFDALNTAVKAVKLQDAEFMRLVYDKPVDVLASTIRPTIKAPPGKILRIADYNAIENRVLGWMTGCDAILDVFRKGLDPYKAFGVEMYGVPYDDLTKTHRTNSKPAVLGAGYMLSGGDLNDEGEKTGLWGYAENMGIELSKKEAHHAVRVFREIYPEVVSFWYDIDAIFRKTIINKPVKPYRFPIGFSGQCLKFGYIKPCLYIELPSGRRLWYVQPKIELLKMPWKDDNGKPIWRDGITYACASEKTGQWARTSTHPGKITENIDQAMARDILACGLVNANEDGFKPILHVHDEIITLEDIADDYHTVERLEKIMCDLPTWAVDMPMAAAGYESPFYMKD